MCVTIIGLKNIMIIGDFCLYTGYLVFVLLFLYRGVQPFGVSLLIAGFDESTPYLFQCDPSVSTRQKLSCESQCFNQDYICLWRETF